ncbi:unnamed protein product [Dicrocoelium dendriticum]|nr:unnamed protein product [Dicrocoelium dendriticum]
MALTSVFHACQQPAAPEQRSLQRMQTANELQHDSIYGLPNYVSSNISSEVQLSLPSNSSDAQANVFIVANSVTANPSQFLPSTPAQSVFFNANGMANFNIADALRFRHPPLPTWVCRYPGYCSTPSAGTLLDIVNLTKQQRILRMTNSTAATNDAESMLQLYGSSNVNRPHSENSYELHCAVDDGVCPKQTDLNTDCDNEQSLILVIRMLMSGKEVGSIIGKRGENVKKYREESGARINISDGSSPERIVTVIGTMEQIFAAFSFMSQKFEDDFAQGLLPTGDEGLTCPPVTLRLLVPAFQCGSIIGKGGCRIKDVRELTGASIQVASEALPGSTERTVTVSGTAKAIAKCIRHLCEIFLESPIKGSVIPYRPKLATVSQPSLCQNSPLFSTMIQPGVPIHLNAKEQSSNAIHSAATPSQFARAYGIHANYVPTDGNLALPIGFSPTSDSNATTNVVPTSSNVPFVTDLLTDPVQLQPAMNYLDLLHSHMPTFASMSPSHLIANGLSNHLGGASFSIPDLSTLNSGLFGFYSPHTITKTAAGTNYFVTPKLTKSTTGFSEDTVLVSHNGVVNSIGLKDSQSPMNDPADIYSTNNHMSSLHSNVCFHNSGNFVEKATPLAQNKASLLGLPAVPLPTTPFGYSTFGTTLNDGTINTPSEEFVIKEITISNELIGCIIGRGGTTVNEIRNLSKAQVKISNCEDGTKERKITLSGPSQAVDLAHLLINNRVSAELFAGMFAFIYQ